MVWEKGRESLPVFRQLPQLRATNISSMTVVTNGWGFVNLAYQLLPIHLEGLSTLKGTELIGLTT